MHAHADRQTDTRNHVRCDRHRSLESAPHLEMLSGNFGADGPRLIYSSV